MKGAQPRTQLRRAQLGRWVVRGKPGPTGKLTGNWPRDAGKDLGLEGGVGSWPEELAGKGCEPGWPRAGPAKARCQPQCKVYELGKFVSVVRVGLV